MQLNFTSKENHNAAHAEIHFNRLMASAAIECGKYISPTDADIAEAGPEWKPSLPVMEVEELAHLPKRRNPTSYDWWWA